MASKVSDVSKPQPKEKAKRGAKAEYPAFSNANHSQKGAHNAKSVSVQVRFSTSGRKPKQENTQRREKRHKSRCPGHRQHG